MKYQRAIFVLAGVILLVSGYIFVSYNNKTTQTLPITPGVTTTTPDLNRTIFVVPEEDITVRQQRDIVSFTDAVVGNLRDKDFQELAQRVHPVKGLRISPYQYVDVSAEGQQAFFASGEAFLAQTTSSTPRVWGHADGTGDTIRLDFAKFYSDWLYDHDYLQAPNVRVFRKYTSISDTYPDARVVLYEYPGFDAKFGGMDWSGLVVGIEEYEGQWYVVVLAHAQWMI